MIPVEYAFFIGFGLYILNVHCESCTHIYTYIILLSVLMHNILIRKSDHIMEIFLPSLVFCFCVRHMCILGLLNDEHRIDQKHHVECYVNVICLTDGIFFQGSMLNIRLQDLLDRFHCHLVRGFYLLISFHQNY